LTSYRQGARLYVMASTKRKLTIYLEPDVARAAKVRAARLDKHDSEVIEEALLAHLGMAALDEAQSLSRLSEDEAINLANAEVHAARRRPRRRR
jgi:hypothetical protein